MQHLHTSLYARVFQYAYPRRVLAIAYCEKHKGELNALGEEVLAEQFPSSIVPAVQKIKETYHANWDTIVADTRSSLLANAAYYKKILKGEIQETPLEDLEGANLETDEED